MAAAAAPTMAVSEPPLSTVRAMCRSVVLIDWGRLGTSIASVAEQVSFEAGDTRQAVGVVRAVLLLLLDYLSPRELREVLREDEEYSLPRWWEGTLGRCKDVAAVLAKKCCLAPGNTPLQCMLIALGLVPCDRGRRRQGRSLRQHSAKADSAFVTAGSRVAGLCAAAASAASCACPFEL